MNGGTSPPVDPDHYHRVVEPVAGTGIGVDCGKSGLVVVDLDVKNGVDGVAGWKQLNDGRPRRPYYAATPSGGWHLYYRDPAGRYRNCASQVAPGVDVRGVGGYVVAPGVTRLHLARRAAAARPRRPPRAAGWHPPQSAPEAAPATGTSSTGTPSTPATWPPSRPSSGSAGTRVPADGYVAITRPGKTAGSSASIGHIGPGIVKVFTPNWPPLKEGGVYDRRRAGRAHRRDRRRPTRPARSGSPTPARSRAARSPGSGRTGSPSAPSPCSPAGKASASRPSPTSSPPTSPAARLAGVHHGTPRDVIVAATEDSWAHTIVPRLMAAGADLDRVYRVDVLTTAGDETPLVLPLDVVGLGARVAEVDAALILFDPIICRLDRPARHPQGRRGPPRPRADRRDRRPARRASSSASSTSTSPAPPTRSPR